MKKKLRIGLIGLGRISPKHRKSLEAMDDKYEIVAVCDSNSSRLENVELRKYQRFSSLDEMISRNHLGLDYVSVMTPSGLHATHSSRIIQEGINVVVEKPLSLTLRDAEKLEKEAAKLGRDVFVVKQNRYNKPVRGLLEKWQAGLLGDGIFASASVIWSRGENYYAQDDWRGTWALDGGVIANQASHHIDLLTLFMGEAKSVFASGGQFLASIQAEDTATVSIEFESGALGSVFATTAARPANVESTFTAMGTKGVARIAGAALDRFEIDITLEDDKQRPNADTGYDPAKIDIYGEGHSAFYNELHKHWLGLPSDLAHIKQALKTTRLLSAIYSSIYLGQKVFVANHEPHPSLGLQ